MTCRAKFHLPKSLYPARKTGNRASPGRYASPTGGGARPRSVVSNDRKPPAADLESLGSKLSAPNVDSHRIAHTHTSVGSSRSSLHAVSTPTRNQVHQPYTAQGERAHRLQPFCSDTDTDTAASVRSGWRMVPQVLGRNPGGSITQPQQPMLNPYKTSNIGSTHQWRVGNRATRE
jgi:hypothetical protein